MCWQPTSVPFNSSAISEDVNTGALDCSPDDMAYELLTCPPPCPNARIDFDVTPDDSGNTNDCAIAGVTTITTEYAFTQDIVFGTAVDNFNPPAVEIRDDGACTPTCRSNGVPAFTGDWWCQFRIGAAPGQPGQLAGVTDFSAELCFIDAPPGIILMEGYNNSRTLVATASNTTGGTEVLSIAAPPGELIAYVRVVSSDPNRGGGLSIDCLAYPNPLPRTDPTDCTVFSNLDAFIFFNEQDGKVLKGIEDFEPPVGNVPPGGIAMLADPLRGGVPNVDPGSGLGFPNGLANLNLIIQSNLLGPGAPDPVPGGGLVALGEGFITPGPPPVPNSIVVGSVLFADSTDLIFTPEDNHTGVGFDLIDPIGVFTAVITVFNKNNEVIGQFDWPAAPFKTFFGIWCPETIGRINIAGLGPDGSPGGELVDNIYLYREIDKCPWDCGDSNGVVDIVDLLALLSQWNGPGSCDFDGNGVVNIVDLLALLSAWGPCPCGSPGTGSCFVPNGTPSCEDQDCCFLVCSIDPFCCDVAWDQLCADEANQLCVPIDCNDPGRCQFSDLTNAYESDGVNGIAADNFVLVSSGAVANVCWRGVYFDNSVSADCGPGPDDYRVRYYTDAGGLPGGLIAEFSQAAATLAVTPPMPTGNIIAGLATEYENVGTHAPLFLSGGVCYWVEIINTGLTGTCQYFWSLSSDGDIYAVHDFPPNGYDAADGRQLDFSFCLNLPLVAVPPCPQLPAPTPPDRVREGLRGTGPGRGN